MIQFTFRTGSLQVFVRFECLKNHAVNVMFPQHILTFAFDEIFHEQEVALVRSAQWVILEADI